MRDVIRDVLFQPSDLRVEKEQSLLMYEYNTLDMLWIGYINSEKEQTTIELIRPKINFRVAGVEFTVTLAKLAEWMVTAIPAARISEPEEK